MTLQELLKNDEDKRSDHGGKSGEWLADGDSIRWRRACQSPRWHVHQGAGDIAQSLHQSPERLVSGIKHRSHYWSASCAKSITDTLSHLKNECYLFREVCILNTCTLCQRFNHLLHIIGVWNWVGMPNLFVFWRWNLEKRDNLYQNRIYRFILWPAGLFIHLGCFWWEISPVQMSTFSWI